MLKLMWILFIPLSGLSSCDNGTFKADDKKTPAPASPVDPTDPEGPKKPLSPDEITLEVTFSKHDAMFKNCLFVSLDGGVKVKVQCNKDVVQDKKPVVLSVPEGKTCSDLGFTMETFRPIDSDACIRSIRSGDPYGCSYSTEVFSVKTTQEALEADKGFRFSKSSSGENSQEIFGEFEDSTDADFDDFEFVVQSTNYKMGIENTNWSCAELYSGSAD